jgi:hypothetical protein
VINRCAPRPAAVRLGTLYPHEWHVKDALGLRRTARK